MRPPLVSALQRSRWGVNYVPSTGWWYSWVDWNPTSIAEDFAAIASLGCDHIRIHCLWPLFQPNRHMVSGAMLARLAQLLEIADEHGLDVIITVLNGWLSGFDFRPSWLAHDVNLFTDPDAVAAQKRLISEVALRVGEHPRFLGFDVANEPSVLTQFPMNSLARGEGDRWLTEMLTHCQAVAPSRIHSVGMDHIPWLSDSGFSRNTLAGTGDVVPIHAWPFFTAALERYGERGTGTLHLSEYMLELAKAYQEAPFRPVWLQEIGISPEWAPPERMPTYVRDVTAAAQTVSGLWGITWWCSHDIDRQLDGFQNLEYDLGLLTVTNTLKPIGEAFQQAIRESRCGAAPAVKTTALVLQQDMVPDLAFADLFFRLIDTGTRPAIVLAEYAQAASYLADRGIQDVIWPSDLISTVTTHQGEHA